MGWRAGVAEVVSSVASPFLQGPVEAFESISLLTWIISQTSPRYMSLHRLLSGGIPGPPANYTPYLGDDRCICNMV